VEIELQFISGNSVDLIKRLKSLFNVKELKVQNGGGQTHRDVSDNI